MRYRAAVQDVSAVNAMRSVCLGGGRGYAPLTPFPLGLRNGGTTIGPTPTFYYFPVPTKRNR